LRRQSLILISALAGVAGCQGWRPLAKPVPNGTLEGSPEMVRVTRTFGCGENPSRDCVSSRGQVTLFNPRVQGDSLIGYYDRANRERVAMHIKEVVAVDTRQIDPARTAGAAIGGGLILGAIALLAALILVASISY
jgi:hypothetical protein